MIIALNGYAGTGKDTVGKIIQYLNCTNVGDVTIKEITRTDVHDWWLEDQSGWKIKKFAGKLKTIASVLTGIPTEKFEDQEFKKTNLGQEWSDHGMPITVRDLLQRLGTDALRRGLHPNTWVNALMADYNLNYNIEEAIHQVRCYDCGDSWDPYDTEHFLISCPCGGKTSGIISTHKPKPHYPNWIITDCRFPNEAAAIKKAGGIVVRVNRPGV